MSKFHISTQILQGNALFSGKIYTAGKILHNRRSWQISSMPKDSLNSQLELVLNVDKDIEIVRWETDSK